MGPDRTPARVGRYLLFDEIARGGMASVHVGRLEGPAGFKRTVAVKRLHDTLGRDPDFVTLFLDEARIAARIEHPNVVPVLDVVSVDREVLLVMEYVHGESLSELLYECQRRGQSPPLRIIAQIMVNVLTGLHAAHETCDENGRSLQIVHRDVSPHNVMVSADGIARLVDFGIARAERRASAPTKEGNVRGKLAYMAPEQLDEDGQVDRKADVYAAALVFCEAIIGRRVYSQEASVIIARKLTNEAAPPRESVPDLPADIDAIIVKGMSRDQKKRHATALEMARAIEAAIAPVSPREIAEWVADLAGDKLRERAAVVAASSSDSGAVLGRVRGPAGSVVSTNDMTLPKARVLPSKAVMIGLGALLAIGGLGTCVALGRTPTMTIAAAQASPTLGTAPPTTASAPSPEPAAVASAVSAASSASASSASAPSAASSVVEAAASAKKKPPKGAGGVGTTTTAKPGGKQCDPPWRIDEHGVRILKKECF